MRIGACGPLVAGCALAYAAACTVVEQSPGGGSGSTGNGSSGTTTGGGGSSSAGTASSGSGNCAAAKQACGGSGMTCCTVGGKPLTCLLGLCCAPEGNPCSGNADCCGANVSCIGQGFCANAAKCGNDMCQKTCSDLYGCGVKVVNGMKLCPGFKGTDADRLFFLCGMNNSGCGQSCVDQPALSTFVDPNDCKKTIDFIKSASSAFATACNNGL